MQCYLLLFKIISIYNWSKVGTVYSKMGGRGEPQNSKNLPRNLANDTAEFGKICCGKLWALIIGKQSMDVFLVRKLMCVIKMCQYEKSSVYS